MPFDSPAGTAPLDRTSVASLVGRTPLVRLAAFEPRAGVELYAKLESRNPGGSVKDRAALAMIEDGERRGALTPERVLLDATSGNTGIAYAMIAATRGYRVRLCVPANVTAERLALLRAYGAELVLTDPMEGTDGAIREARRLCAEDPGRYFYSDQYNNPANWRAHYETTAPELIEQTDGRLTHFVAGLGTSGTFVGTARRLREWRASVRLFSVQPDSPLNGLEGLKHMATAIVPGIYDAALADEDRRVSTEDAYAMTRRLAREAGLLVGPSSGAALQASLDVARDLAHAVVVTIFPDGGERYLTERFWNEARPPLELTSDVDATIRRHGAAAYPDECCGALLGPRAGVVDDTLALDNRFDGERRRRFAVTPDDYRRAEQRASETSRELLGFYHSHPDHPAVPSAFDLEHAWPNLSYAIVSVRAGRDAELRSWRLRPDRSAYVEELVTLSTPRSPSCP
jgi:S-sulfo-L-cysteine synthase (O-acetyl-L-serine-dependent)